MPIPFNSKPRDSARISDTLNQVQEHWQKAPQLRLGQLLGNVCKSEIQLYYMEDDVLLGKLEAMYKDADKEV